MNLSKAQVSLYWKAVSAACQNLGIQGKVEREEYRKSVMEATTGKTSIKELSRTGDFDAVISQLRSDAGCFELAIDSADQAKKSWAYLIKVISIQLMQLKGGEPFEARAYLSGLLDQARLPNGRSLDDNGYWVDLSIADAKRVFAMLDTHRRRLLRKWQSRSSFSPHIRYEINGPILIRVEVALGYYDAIPFRVNWI
ncbi:MAG: hypothetical protein J6W10_02160 [Kiritimatiellae bacterium]|nr:hypothetical protein [Kiritimatiellia bacterium]